jgi:hypothetical protein
MVLEIACLIIAVIIEALFGGSPAVQRSARVGGLAFLLVLLVMIVRWLLGLPTKF